MTIRRQLLNFGPRSTDVRLDRGILSAASPLFAGVVAKPVRACVVTGEGEDAEAVLAVERSLVDAGFDVSTVALPAGDAASLASASRVHAHLAERGVTREDLIVGVGDADVCSIASYCGATWLSATPVALVPTTLDAMVRSATEMTPLQVAGVAAVEVAPQIALIVCDLDFILSASPERNALGYVEVVGAYLSESRKAWERLADSAPLIAQGSETALFDALCSTQSARLNTVKSVSPSARQALRFGRTTADALRALGVDAPEGLLLAEGMRFEARLAVDACDFSVDAVFELEDRLEELGIEEACFTLDTAAFIDALRAACHGRANRFMLPLPKYPGTIRLSNVDDEVLERHAAAYLASRVEEA